MIPAGIRASGPNRMEFIPFDKIIRIYIRSLRTAPCLFRNKAYLPAKSVEYVKNRKSSVGRIPVVPKCKVGAEQLLMIGRDSVARRSSHVIYKPVFVHAVEIIVIHKTVIPARNDIQNGSAGVDKVITHFKQHFIVRQVDSPEVGLSVAGHRRCAVKSVFAERSPEPGRIPAGTDMLYQLVNVSSHLFRILGRILVRADMYYL